MSAKIKTNDDVIVLTGKDSGRIGKVIKVVVCAGKKRLIVSGVNVCKKHVKNKPGSDGGVLNKELAIDMSNVAMLDPKYRSATKVGFKFVDGKKVRFAKASGEIID